MARPDVSEERKSQILTAATQVFVRDGLDRARMEAIAQEAGLSVGGVYWYFKSKDDVVHALLQEMFDADLKGLRHVLGAEGTVHDRLIGYVRHSLAENAEQSPLSNELYSLATRSERACEHLRAYLAEFQRLLAELIEQGVRSGEFRPVNTMQAAWMLIALYEGFTELAMVGAADANAESALLDILELALSGLNRQPAQPAALPAQPPFTTGKWQPGGRK